MSRRCRNHRSVRFERRFPDRPVRLLPALLVALLIGATSGASAAAQDDSAKPASIGTSEEHQAFVNALLAESADEVIGLMDERLLELIDAPVLAMLMKAVRDELGEIKSVNITDRKELSQNDEQLVKSVSRITFEQGEGTLSLTTGANGKVLGFNLNSDRIVGWLKQPGDTAVYQQGSGEFIRRFLDRNVEETFEMMHGSLQQVVSREKLQEMMNRVGDANGPLKELAFDKETWEIRDQLPTLLLHFNIECEKRTATCEMKIQFIGMQGHITGFHFR